MTTIGMDFELPPRAEIDVLVQDARILIVEDEALIRDILVRKLTALGYRCETCDNGRTALSLLASSSYDLVLTDLMLPEIGGLALLRQVQSISPDTAVILVTSAVDVDIAVDSLKDGAYDYILKPFSLQEVSVVVARALEKRRLLLENRRYGEILEAQVEIRTQQLRDALDLLRETYHSTLLALGTALDSRDSDTDGHSLRVTLYTMRLARQIGVSGQELKIIEQGALLHDIGKIGIPDELLRKPERLTEDEWLLMRKHPEIGFRILSKIALLKDAAKIVLQHQERYDGTGYPAGLTGDGIVLGSRIFAVADALDCMTTNRPFQKATTFEAARDEIIRVSGTQLDPRIVQKLLEIPLEEWKKVAHEARAQKSSQAREAHNA